MFLTNISNPLVKLSVTRLIKIHQTFSAHIPDFTRELVSLFSLVLVAISILRLFLTLRSGL